jgi:hypothetical protein
MQARVALWLYVGQNEVNVHCHILCLLQLSLALGK